MRQFITILILSIVIASAVEVLLQIDQLKNILIIFFSLVILLLVEANKSLTNN